MNRRKNIAIVGIGRWGKNLLREFNMIAHVDFCYHKGSPETKKWLKKNYPAIKTAHSYEELLDNPSIEAIIIATPIKTHFQFAYKALLSGKHVFVEKPMAENYDQAKKLSALAGRKKMILSVGYIFLYHPIFRKIKGILKKEKIKYLKMSWNKFGTFKEDIRLDLLSHELSIIYGLFGRPLKIKVLKRRRVVTDIDMIALQIKYPKFTIDIEIDRISNWKHKAITLVTSENTYIWEGDQLFKFISRENEFKIINESPVQPLSLECREFIKNLNDKKTSPTDGEFGLEINRLLAKI